MRIHSLREVKRRIMHPEIVAFFHPHISPDYLPNSKLLYYAVGEGMIIYDIQKDNAYIHAALVGGFKKGYKKIIQDQWIHLGVKKITAVIDHKQKNAASICRLLGFKLCSSGSKKIYEVNLCQS